jgi:putative ABC transport system permease protein
MPRVWRFFNRARRDADLHDELRAFVDDLMARNVARGMTPEAARRAALVETGGVEQAREVTREQWFGNSMETLVRDVRYGNIRPMRDYIAASMNDTRFIMLILTGFALASIVLAAIGLYGTLSYLASQRTQEFGIRMALGASASRVVSGVAREGLLLAAVGAALGFAGAMATAQVMNRLLYDLSPWDGTTLVAAAVVIVITALAAAGHPAWRASRVDPTVALRAE